MEIKRNGSQAAQKAPEQHFTGSVRLDPLFQPNGVQRATGSYVTFEPCARSDWHTHATGQLLIVTFGCGLVQSWGGPIEEIRVGDVVWAPPNEKHWHGATPTTAMTHLAITEGVDWLEKVSDEQYSGSNQGERHAEAQTGKK
jgi:quercetin dioxygenase-like cupin family protein